MKKVRVPVFGSPGKVLRLDPNATAGATIGSDLRLPDGRLASLESLAAALAPYLDTGTDSPTGNLANTIWRLVREIPPNVRQVEALATAGLVTRKADGTWVTRSITVADSSRLTIEEGDGGDGDPVLDLATVEYVEDGALVAVLLDDYGRVVGARAALLDDLSDIELSDLEDKDALRYDASSQTWINQRSAPAYLIQEDDEYFWTADEFVRGHNIIGVRYAGEAYVYLPHDLAAERIVVVKAEDPAADVTVRIY